MSESLLFGGFDLSVFTDESDDGARKITAIRKETVAFFEGKLPELAVYVEAVRSGLMEATDGGIDVSKMSNGEQRSEIASRIQAVQGARSLSYPSNRNELIAYTVEVQRNIFQMGPLYELLENPDISDIMGHAYDRISIAMRSAADSVHVVPNASFASEEQLKICMQHMLSAMGKQITRETPIVDSIVPGFGARIVVLDKSVTDGEGMVFVIRKQSANRFTPEDMVGRFRSFTPEVADFLERTVIMGANTTIVGETGSGKTSLLSAMLSYIPDDRHTLLIEDTPEIQIPDGYETVTRFRTQSNVSIIDLLKPALRSNPRHLIIGETRGREALEMLQAMKTGHPGMTTVHAGDGRGAVSRLVGMMLSKELTPQMLERDIAEVMDLFIIQSVIGDEGKRRRGISAIYEITPTITEYDIALEDAMPTSNTLTAREMYNNNPQYVQRGETVTLRTLYRFDAGEDRLVAAVLPSDEFMGRMDARGLLDEYLRNRTM